MTLQNEHLVSPSIGSLFSPPYTPVPDVLGRWTDSRERLFSVSHNGGVGKITALSPLISSVNFGGAASTWKFGDQVTRQLCATRLGILNFVLTGMKGKTVDVLASVVDPVDPFNCDLMFGCGQTMIMDAPYREVLNQASGPFRSPSMKAFGFLGQHWAGWGAYAIRGSNNPAGSGLGPNNPGSVVPWSYIKNYQCQHDVLFIVIVVPMTGGVFNDLTTVDNLELHVIEKPNPGNGWICPPVRRPFETTENTVTPFPTNIQQGTVIKGASLWEVDATKVDPVQVASCDAYAPAFYQPFNRLKGMVWFTQNGGAGGAVQLLLKSSRIDRAGGLGNQMRPPQARGPNEDLTFAAIQVLASTPPTGSTLINPIMGLVSGAGGLFDRMEVREQGATGIITGKLSGYLEWSRDDNTQGIEAL